MQAPVFWVIVLLSFASRLGAVTKSDGPDRKQDSPESHSPEEITHQVIPCSCVAIHRCPSLLKELKQPISATSSSMQKLQRFTCGFRGFTPYVCCEDLVTKHNHAPPRGVDSGNSVQTAHDSAAAADDALDPDIIYYPGSHKQTQRPPTTGQYPGYDYSSSSSSSAAAGGSKPTTLNSGSGPDPVQAYPTYDGNRPTPRPQIDAYKPNHAYRPNHNTRPAYGITPPTSGVSDQYDPTEDNIAAVFGIGSSTTGSHDDGYNPNSYERPTTTEGRPPPTKYPGQYGPSDDGTYGEGKIPTTYLPNYEDHNRDEPNKFGNNLPPSDRPAHGYDPSQDISTVYGKRPTTYLPNNGLYDHTTNSPTNSYFPTRNPFQGYDPSQDISTVFGKRPSSTQSPGSTEFENTNTVTQDSYLPTNNPNGGYDSPEEISTIFGKLPSTYSPNYNGYFPVSTTPQGVNSRPLSPGHELFNPTEAFFTAISKRPSTKPHTDGTFNPVSDVTTPFSHRPSTHHVFRPSFGPAGSVSPPFGYPETSTHPFNHFNRENGGYDSYPGISETLVPPPPPKSTYPSHYGGKDYDPTYDIAQTFGNNNHGVPFGSSPPTFSNNYPSTTSSQHGLKYDPTHDISAVFRRPTGSTSSTPPDLPLESFYPPDTDDLPKNRTEFKFHLETKAPPGNVTIHLNSAPSHPYFRPKGYYPVTEHPLVTVSYSLQVKNSEMEKQFANFRDLFFKNFEKAKETQGIKPNDINPFYYYQGNKLSYDYPQMGVDFSNQPFDGQPIQFSSIVREPRSTSTKRNTRQTASDYYPFQPLYYANRYQQPYFFGPSTLPNFGHNSFQKRSSALSASPDGAATETSGDYDSYDDYPDTTNSDSDSGSDTDAVGYRFHHRIQDRHISNWFQRGKGKNGKHGKDESAIVFPSDDYDGPKHYPHTDRHPGNHGFWGKIGSFFTGKNRHPDQYPQGAHHYPNYPQYPAWGYNPHGYGHVHPGFQYNTEETETFTPTSTSNAGPPQDVTNADSVPMPSETTAPKDAVVEAAPEAPVAAPAADVVPVVRAETAVAPAAVVPAEAEGRVAKRALIPENACGVSVDERIVGGKAASIGAYPWIARIGYVRTGSDRVLYRCAATLINSIYVLTAAHCVINLPTGLRMTTIRLGELNEGTDPDCDENECADPVQNYTPAQVSVHASYDTPQFKNDIGLIRLDRPVTLSSYVSPICLPFDGLSSKNFTGMKASVAGWGASSPGVTSSNPVLQWVSLSVAPMDRCTATFATRTGVKVGDGQLCAGGVDGKDSCEGDSGGPLMRPEQVDSDSVPRKYIIGIVSFGAKRCGSDNMPGVYTSVGAYMDWILDKILP